MDLVDGVHEGDGPRTLAEADAQARWGRLRGRCPHQAGMPVVSDAFAEVIDAQIRQARTCW